MVFAITPGIMMIRLDRLLQNATVEKKDTAVKLCRKYVADLEMRNITILTDKETTKMAQEMFEIELLLLMDVIETAVQQINNIRQQVIKKLVNFSILRNRLSNDGHTKDTIGDLTSLPQDILLVVVDKLQNDYVW